MAADTLSPEVAAVPPPQSPKDAFLKNPRGGALRPQNGDEAPPPQVPATTNRTRHFQDPAAQKLVVSRDYQALD